MKVVDKSKVRAGGWTKAVSLIEAPAFSVASECLFIVPCILPHTSDLTLAFSSYLFLLCLPHQRAR